QEGDRIIQRTAQLLSESLSGNEVLARTGGDEFSILLPSTSGAVAHETMLKIQNYINEYNKKLAVDNYKINLALGYGTKENDDVEFSSVFKVAEDHMYKRKMLERNSSHSSIISSITATMIAKSQETEEHAERIKKLAQMVGKKIKLTQEQIDDLALLATLHDIGKVGIDEKILNKPGRLTEEEWVEMKKHPEIGYRIAMASPELMSIAEYILCHHERWDGTGYPRGLKGQQIPLLSRIIAITDAYDAMISDRPYRKAMTKVEAISEIRANAGTQFDPDCANFFVNLMLHDKDFND
ncbi:MAG: HD-GYP domain-containing protein, partial [Acholeplasmataceae bacterium]|nr:HD-GYP domain-containing protein [Acholeplasmataceae bacterium]